MDFMEKNNKEHEEIRIENATQAKDTEHIKGTTERIEKKIDCFIDSAEKKFAPIWVARVLIWGGSIVGGAVLLAIIGLVIKS